MMYLAVIAWVACGLLQVASGQTACQNAVMALTNSAECTNALQSANAAVVCGTCRDIFVAIENNCDGQDTASIREAYNASCGPCGIATRALQADASCTAAISGPNPTVICSGTCNNLLNSYVSSCRSQQGVDITETQMILNVFCGGGGVSSECTTAANAVFTNTVCTTALNNDDSGTLCSGTCRPLFETVVNTCPPNTFGITQADINQQCGGTSTIKGLGLFSLLLATAVVSWMY